MKQLPWFLLACIAACGDSNRATPDASTVDGTSFDFEPGCYDVGQTSPDQFSAPEEFGAIAAGSLAGWDPNGRWFATGTRIGGQGSFHFSRKSDTEVVVDRDDQNLGTIDDDKIFHRFAVTAEMQTIIIAKRIANRLDDGTVRVDRAFCDGVMCRVCTAKLVRAERHDPKPNENISFVGEYYGTNWGPGFTFNVRVVDTIAYLIRLDGLHIIDVADPANPVELGHYKRAGDGYSNDVKIVDAGTKRFAIIADTPVDVVDVTNPAAPTLAAQIPEEAHTLFVEARNNITYAYFGNYDGSTPIFDVTNPAAPVRLGRYRTNGNLVHDLSIANGIGYLNAWDEGFLVVDFTVPIPKLVGAWKPTTRNSSHSNWTTEAGGRKIALHGDEAYGAHLDVVDIDPDSPTFMKPIGEYKTRDWVSIHNIMAFGTKAYFTYYQDGVRILDVADPTKPKLVGYYNTWDPQADYTSSAFFEGAVGIDVDPARKLIYIADSPRGLLILRDETP